MGLEFAGSIAAGALIGWLFDQWLGTAPRGLTIGTICGLVGGAVNFVRLAVLINRQNAGRNALTPRKRASGEIPPPEKDEVRPARPGRYDPRGPVDALDSDDDPDPQIKLPPDHDKW